MSYPARLLRSLSALHWFVVLLSLLLTVTAWQVSSRIADDKARVQFEYQVEQLNELIRDRMQKYEFALMSGAGAIRAAGGEVNLGMWRRFSEVLSLEERLPGINGIGVVNRVSPEHLEAFISEKKRERPYFGVHPDHDRNDFWPIVYIEPEASNRAAVGLDMAHETNRYRAAYRAMTSGDTQITGPIVLVQDEQKTPGFLFYHPFYETSEVPPEAEREARFRGLVYAPFIMSKLMEGALANVNRLVHFRVTDGDTRLYSELDESRGNNYDPSPMFEASYSLPMYGRDWSFDVQTTKRFEAFNVSRQPQVILVAGLIIDALIITVFGLMANARRRAERKALEKTEELRESLAFINTLTDNLPLTVSVWDSDLRCRFMNAYGEHWFPFSKEEAIGKSLEQFLGRALVEQRQPYYQKALNGESVQATAEFSNRNGEVRDVVVSYYPVTLSGEPCFMATTMDVTTLVQREKELQSVNQQLKLQKQEAESAVVVKTAFLANMSHEIRTPMNAIIGVLVLLQDAGLEEHPRRLVKKAFVASEALLQLLNDILDLSKIEADHIELDFHPFDIDALIHRSVDLFAIVAEEKGLKLRVSIDPNTPNRVVGDLLRISQICTNLVGNAVKFTTKGRISVRIGFEPSGSHRGRLRIEVEDTGVGIKAEDQDRIFDSFRQADESTSRNFGGTGLGLAISQRLATLMKAELDVNSQFGRGSTFWLSVPVEVVEGSGTIASTLGSSAARVFHHGFRQNLALLEDYREHWSLELISLDDLTHWLEQCADMTQTETAEASFLLIDLDGSSETEVVDFLSRLIKSHERYPLWAVLVVVPAGFSRDWLTDFHKSGGRITSEPLTPSKLYEHFSQQRGRATEVAGAPKPQFRKLTALIVDDVPLNCEIVESYLHSFGVNACSVQTGDQALSMLGQRSFDLVLMDLHLDGETGQQVAERILGVDRECQPIIVALSASISDQDRMSAKAAGMTDYLTKPVVPKDIRLLLETYFDHHKDIVYVPEDDESRQESSTGLPDVISQTSFQALFNSDYDLFNRCLRSFLASAPDLIRELQGASGARSMRDVSHKIKGAAANIADDALAKAAADVELAQSDDDLEDLVPVLRDMLTEHTRRLEVVSKGEPPAPPQRISQEEFSAALARVTSKLSGNRIASDSDLRIVINRLLAEGRVELSGRLRHALETYDFRQALALLNDVSF